MIEILRDSMQELTKTANTFWKIQVNIAGEISLAMVERQTMNVQR